MMPWRWIMFGYAVSVAGAFSYLLYVATPNDLIRDIDAGELTEPPKCPTSPRERKIYLRILFTITILLASLFWPVFWKFAMTFKDEE